MKKIIKMLLLSDCYGDLSKIKYPTLITEKYDGIRAYWTGDSMYTRGGNKINLPLNITGKLPNTPIDGELWAGRGNFDFVSSVVRKKKFNNKDWFMIKYMIFDAPGMQGTLLDRLNSIREYVHYPQRYKGYKYVEVSEMIPIENAVTLSIILDSYIAGGAEGLVSRCNFDSYERLRSKNAIKIKKSDTDIVLVLGYNPGTGKYKGKVGSLICLLEKGKLAGQKINVGSGLTDKLRMSPPKQGKRILIQYFGLTGKGNYKFPTFKSEVIDE